MTDFVDVTFNQPFNASYPFVSHTNDVSVADPEKPGRTKIVREPVLLDVGPVWDAAGQKMVSEFDRLVKEVESYENTLTRVIESEGGGNETVRDEPDPGRVAEFKTRFAEATAICCFAEGQTISVCEELAVILEKAGVVGERKPPQLVIYTGQPGKEITRQPMT